MPEVVFRLNGETIELFKLLKAAGLCESGGNAKYAVAQAQVKVDGQVETRKACQVRRGQQVAYAGSIIRVE
jgi:ribosome-associated protein